MKNTRDMLGRSPIIPVKEALTRLKNGVNLTPVPMEEISLEDGLGRIVATDILSPENLPPYPRSTMDGYALRGKDTYGASESMPGYLTVSGEVAMGEFPRQGPALGSCFKIATGGILPPGTNAVLMLEHTVPVDDTMIEVMKQVAEGCNVIGVGDDIREGELVLAVGHRLRPQDLGLLAGLGIATISVRRKVRVAILSTGDEIVSYKETPAPGKIRDINAINLAGLVFEAGAVPTMLGIVGDQEELFRETVSTAMADHDIILLSGSSSVGARDLGEKVLASLGEPGIIVHGVAVKPGKPVIIASAQNTALFGLPGHPVSAAVAFELFVEPTIMALSGTPPSIFSDKRRINATLMRNLNSASGRLDVVRVRIEKNGVDDYHAYPVLGKSGAISTQVRAHGNVVIAEETQGLLEGGSVVVNLF